MSISGNLLRGLITFMSGRRPEADYFDAWRLKDADLISRVVSENVEYKLRHDKVLNGRDQVVRYWKKIFA